jgi:pimeloyl-ACP methyl ester carboxylesterase
MVAGDSQGGEAEGTGFRSSYYISRSSPFDPPETTDTTFVIDNSLKLDGFCKYKDEGPITFEIEVARYVGELNSDGTLKDAVELVAKGLLSETAILTIPAHDVDVNGRPESSYPPEVDRVLFNGDEVGLLDGDNQIWKLNTFKVPIQKVRFAQKGSEGSETTPGINEIQIDIDTANSEEIWCTSIDWGALSFKAISPVLLVHGNNSDAGFFDRQGLSWELEDMGLVVEGCGQCDYPIELEGAPIAANALDLANRIPQIVKSLGVDSIHLVAHSKGGLDSREFLSKYLSAGDPEFEVLSLTTLGTPHNGSPGADLLVARSIATREAMKTEYVGFPVFTRQLAFIMSLSESRGWPDLTTSSARSFNASNLPMLPSQTLYVAIGGDADVNGSETIDLEEEWVQLSWENTGLAILGKYVEPVINLAYQFMGRTRTVELQFRREPCDSGRACFFERVTSECHR